MRDWIKPKLIIEEFELSQHVASGCGTKVSNSSYPKTINFTYEKNNGATQDKEFTFEDSDYDTIANGKIDKEEFSSILNYAKSQTPTNGHWSMLTYYRIGNSTYDTNNIFCS